MLTADIGATWTRVGRDSDSAPVLTYPTPTASGELVTQLVKAAERLAPGTEIGVACPGVVTADGHVSLSFHGALNDLPLADQLSSRLGVRATVSNDVDAQALGAWQGGRLACIGLGTRVGGAVVDERGLSRRSTFQGEFGHLSTGFTDTHACECGGEDCLDLAAAGHRLETEFGQWWTDEDATTEVCNRVATALARALRSVIVTTGPDRVLLTGRIFVHERLRVTVTERHGTTVWGNVPLDFRAETWTICSRGLLRLHQNSPVKGRP